MSCETKKQRYQRQRARPLLRTPHGASDRARKEAATCFRVAAAELVKRNTPRSTGLSADTKDEHPVWFRPACNRGCLY
jgi:hypothetical protein